MPWRKLSFERTVKIYRDALLEIINDKCIDSDMPLRTLMIRSEILKRDFTKRQMSILLGIYTLSYAICKKSAIFPKLSDFSLIGVGVTKIKSELKQLEKMNVIDWDRKNNRFTIKDYQEWDAPYVSGHNYIRSTELYLLNLEDAGIDVAKLAKKVDSEG